MSCYGAEENSANDAAERGGGSLQIDILNQEKGRDLGCSGRSALGKEKRAEIRRQVGSRAGCCRWEWDAE